MGITKEQFGRAVIRMKAYMDKKLHIHENKSTLDKISESEDGGLLYDGKEISGNGTYSTEEILIGKWINGEPIYRKVIGYINKTVNASLPTADTAVRTIYEYKNETNYTQALTIKNLYGGTECSNNDGYYSFLINDVQKKTVQCYTSSSMVALSNFSDVLNLEPNDILKINTGWKNSHYGNSWRINFELTAEETDWNGSANKYFEPTRIFENYKIVEYTKTKEA